MQPWLISKLFAKIEFDSNVGWVSALCVTQPTFIHGGNMYRSTRITSILALVLATTSISFAAQNHSDNKIITPNEMQWTVGPDALPKGAEMVVLEGNPAKAGPFTLRLKVPADYKIPPHWHPVVEHVTVISGTFYMGMGDKFDEKVATEMPVGSFAFMQPKMHHFAFSHDAAVIQLHGVGPWGITYLNPKDDPRNTKQ
jgi:hypothetical protein